ncbi:MAG TPA: porin [Lysobacter sp.]
MARSLQMMVAAGIAACCALPVHAQVKLGTVAGSDVAFEGLWQVDGNWYDNDVADLDGRPDGRDRATGLRRAELALKGSGPGGLSWVVGYDVEAERFLDANVGYAVERDSGRHALVLGQAKQPGSLEELSSSKHNDFIAKAAATNVFATGRRFGVGYAWERSDRGVALAYYGRELTRNQGEGAGFALRGYWAPVATEGHVVHLGLSYADRDTPADSLRLRVRPNADLASVRLVDSGRLTDVDRFRATGLEAMWIRGPVKLQAEYFLGGVERIATGDYGVAGGYASLVWNPGGQTWGYRGGLPRTPSAGDGNAGLWQLALRLDRIDFDDGPVRGGRMDAWTVGVNWYWRKHAKLMLNYVDVSSRRFPAGIGTDVDDNPDIVEARVQLHW